MIMTIDSPKKQIRTENMLSPIEQQLLQMMADGKTEKGISEKLKIDELTVGFLQDQLLKTFNVSEIDDLIAVALDRGIIH